MFCTGLSRPAAGGPPMSDTSLGFRGKVLTSAKLSALKFSFTLLQRLASTIILTRLLAPEIYGVFAIVMVYLYLLALFSDLGIRSLILTKEGEVDDNFLRTCWTVMILRGLLIAVLSLAIAGVIFALQGYGVFSADSPYSAPTLPWAIAALGAITFLTGFQSTMMFVSERNMQMGRVTVLHIVLDLIALVATIVLAFYLRSIWALVLGAAIKAVFQVILSFVLFPGPAMRLQLHKEYSATVLSRGKWIIGSSILTALSNSADRLVLGFVMTSSTFGFYYIARQLVDLVVKLLHSIDSQISLQVFTQLQKSNVEAFRRNYYRYRLFFDALAGLSTGGMVVLAPLAVDIIFDDRYRDVGPMVQILIWSGLLVGPLLLRGALGAMRYFKELALLSAVSTVTLWVGLLVAVFVFDSVLLALMVISLHRLPEAMICILWGGDRDWVVIWREFLSFFFCGIGIVLGSGVLWVWNAVV